MANPSNKRLLGFLSLVLAALLVLIVREVLTRGRFAGAVVGIYLVPIVFVVSLIVGILIGLRKR